jgi:hypothetical protein
MNCRTILKLTLIFVAVAAAFLTAGLGPQAHAQQGCAPLRILIHFALPASHPIDPVNDTWGGDFWGILGADFVSGVVGGNDGTVVGHAISNQATNGHYVFLIGTDSFTMQVNHAEFNFPPGKAGFGQYRGHGSVVAGTGKFQYASGSIDWDAPFIVWSPDGTNFYARANMNAEGNICGISAQ